MQHIILDGILGLCVGDALGVPFEFTPREDLKKDTVTKMGSHGTYNQPIGTWSDDTSMSLCLVDSLTQGLNYYDIMKKFLDWYTEGEYTPHGEAFDIGAATKKAILRFSEGIHPLSCGGAQEMDNGNGSLMRILPILFYLRTHYGDALKKNDEVYTIIHNVSRLTHAHPRTLIACGIYLNIAALIAQKLDMKEAVHTGVQHAFDYYSQRQEYEPELHHFARLNDIKFKDIPETEIHSTGYVVHTLEASIWSLLNSSNYKDAVLKAVNLGHDTDTIATVAGGLAGLHYGADNIPKEWLDSIVRKDYIVELCHQLEKSLNQ